MPGLSRALAAARAATSNGTSGFSASTRSAPSAIATDACSVRRNAPST